jgi:hypothetical protein
MNMLKNINDNYNFKVCMLHVHALFSVKGKPFNTNERNTEIFPLDLNW